MGKLTILAGRWERSRHTGIRTALVFGFALVFALWLAWGYQFVRAFQEMERPL